jgi:hypothetical protein
MAEMVAVTVGGPGLVAVGHASEASVAVWVSADGYTWSRVPDPQGVLGGTGRPVTVSIMQAGPLSLTRAGSGLVATDGRTVWTSADGYQWSQAADGFPGIVWDWLGRNMAAAGPGIVAVGSSPLPNEEWTAAAWHSTDGSTWTRYTDPSVAFSPVGGCPEPTLPPASDSGGIRTGGVGPGLCSTVIEAVTVGGPGLVAVGYDTSTGGPAVWVARPADP